MSSGHSHNDLPKDGSTNESIVYFEKQYSMGWLLSLLLLVLSAGLVMYFIKGGNDDSIPGLQADMQEIVTAPDTAAKANGLTHKSFAIKLSDSTQITAYKNGIENQLVLYIMSKNPADSISKNRWFDFDDLNFKTGSADITDSSMHQVQNIAAILKVYPRVKIKIGGYTDKTGDDALNLKLSQQRADAVIAVLKKAGVKPEQLAGAEGYGSQFAKAAADAPDEEKQKDRRISVNVRAK
jgi:outer membrane protein OmpA-like peptidoglycan-associated protein